MGSRCAVKNCPNSFYSRGKDGKTVRFFRFPNPKEEERLFQWKLACGDEEIMKKDPSFLYSNNRICSIHFESDLLNSPKLSRTAIPTINLFQVDSESYLKDHCYFRTDMGDMDVANFVELATESRYVDVGTQTDIRNTSDQESQTVSSTEVSTQWSSQTQTTMELSALTPRKRKLKTLVQNKRKKLEETKFKIAKLEQSFRELSAGKNIISKENFKNACDTYLPKFLGNAAKIVSDLKDRKVQGRRYTKEFKQQALSLYYSGPRAYKRLVKNYNFPSVSTLRRMTENLQKKPGLNDFVFRSFKLRMKGKSKLDRLCIITMDEVSLKSGMQYDPKNDEIIGFHDLGKGKQLVPAKNALVLMARGIHDNWKQPLGYFFLNTVCSAPDLKSIVFDCITKMDEAGLDVRALVSDMGSNFTKFAGILGVTIENGIFQVNNRKIYYIFDTPHLLKGMRNILMKYTVKFEGNEASWKHIEQLYELEKDKDLRMVTKLTDAHIYTTNFQKMKVKYASQVFSSTVVSAMSTYIANGEMDAAAAATANLLEKFDHLFDLLNSSTTKTTNQYKKPYKGTMEQEAFLISMLDNLKEMKVFAGRKDVTRTFKTINCFQITIKGVKALWQDLKGEGMKQMKTRRLNQDCVEIFFGKIRQQGGNSVNPTPLQFMNAFKKLCCMDLLDCIDTFNCAADVDELLMGIEEVKIPVESKTLVSRSQRAAYKITNVDFRRNDLPSRNVEQYISGYLLRKCLKKHSCADCQGYARATNDLGPTKLFCHFKGDTDKYGKREGTFGKLMMADDSFVAYIGKIENLLLNNIKSVAGERTAEQLFEKLKVIPFSHPCLNFPFVYMLKLFIGMRLFYIVKFYNRKFQSEKISERRMKKSRKLQILKHK